ncbi:unnamed protein product [Danaus chrysippus]|uniref:(African queen) hypothetical protein n=1 Tax=Danaus chrysippus TaxID=151541 RepID=A0A8J2QZH0_9NEOP|nr:unnamed protein product [Danaus chrysippus]
MRSPNNKPNLQHKAFYDDCCIFNSCETQSQRESVTGVNLCPKKLSLYKEVHRFYNHLNILEEDHNPTVSIVVK